jgi:hypothetical protein
MAVEHSETRPLDLAEFQQLVSEAVPSAVVVPPRILRRVIKRDRGLHFFGGHVPHRRVYTLTSQRLAAIVDAQEVGLPAHHEAWPEVAILLPRPETEELENGPRQRLLAEVWRALFHARIHVELEHARASGAFAEEDLRQRIQSIGPVEFEEIRLVLRSEGMLLPPGDDWTVFVEFAAVYLELRRFAPTLIAHTFPGIKDREAIDRLLAADVDEGNLFAATRPPGARDPDACVGADCDEEVAGPEPTDDAADDDWEPGSAAARRLLHRAQTASARGNLVRAAILRVQASHSAPARVVQSLRTKSVRELDRLVGRLQIALQFDAAEADRWRRALPALLDTAARGFWCPEARLLYDLQKVCNDHEREVFTVDLIEWIRTLGRRPLRRLQPLLREVMIANHLRTAYRRLRSVHLRSDDRGRLAAVIRHAAERADAALRDRLRDPIDQTLNATGFVPKNLPERVAYRKLVEELLDRIAGRGFLSLGDLRDACSRSKLKLPDLSGPLAFIKGDRLLQADRALAESLDGVYRRGEIYLRWLQRLSALAFATPWGRFLTLYVALPYGGAFVLLEGLQHFAELIGNWMGASEIHVRNRTSFFLLGTVALGVINVLSFRHRFLTTLRSIGRLLRFLVVDGLAQLLRIPLLRFLVDRGIMAAAWNYVLKPALVALPFAVLARQGWHDARVSGLVAGAAFLGANFLVNTRAGRNLEEIIADDAIRAWRQLVHNFAPGVFQFVMAMFHTIVETVDRMLYAVDEWLRFRVGQRRRSTAVKAVLGAGWFFVAYLIRFYVNLLIEPQVNPIKHFPVVTVSHKIILPASVTLARLIATPLVPVLGTVIGNFIAITTVFLLPGVFGFLVWELKENWRLYEANRSEVLKPVIVGDHGETIVRLLRPGFHSGTLPKLFARLRKSERLRLEGGGEKAVLKLRDSLHHAEESVARFVDREFLELARQSRTLGPLGIEAGSVCVATNRIEIELNAGAATEPLRILFEERAGCLIGSVVQAGWLPDLSAPQRRALLTAVVGLYKLSGVEWLREPIRTAAGPRPPRGEDAELEATPVPFTHVAITWQRWVDAWERDQSGMGHPPRFVVGLPVLPTPQPERGKRRRTSRK